MRLPRTNAWVERLGELVRRFYDPYGPPTDAAELSVIDDALDLAGAPKAETRVGRIRKMAEKDRTTKDGWPLCTFEVDRMKCNEGAMYDTNPPRCSNHSRRPAPLESEPQAGRGVLKEHERSRAWWASEGDAGLFIDTKGGLFRVEKAVLRRVADMVAAMPASDDFGHGHRKFRDEIVSDLRHRAGDET